MSPMWKEKLPASWEYGLPGFFHAIGPSALFMVFFGGVSLCLTNSVRLVIFGKYEGGIHRRARCPTGTGHRR